MAWDLLVPLESFIVFGDTTALQLIEFILIIALFVTIGRTAYMLIRRYLDDRAGKRQSKNVARAIQYIIFAFGIYVGFGWTLHIEFTGFILSLGIVGVAIAFASQQIVQNLLSGILISIIRPVQLEDWVDLGGVPSTGVARVKDITLMNTVLREDDGRIIIVPNSAIMNGKVVNYTKAGFVAVSAPMWVGPAENMEKIRRIVHEEGDRDPYILPEVSGEEKRAVERLIERRSLSGLFERGDELLSLNPQVNLLDIQGSKVKVEIKVWIREIHRKDEIMSSFLEAVRTRFTAENIELRDS